MWRGAVSAVPAGGPVHGTYARYQWENRRGETCAACRAASAAYMAGRRRTPEGARNSRIARRAREHALAALAAEFPDRYRELYRVARDRETVEAARLMVADVSVAGDGWR